VSPTAAADGRGIPLPVLMIGAGLFFAGSKTGGGLRKSDWTWHPTFQRGATARHDVRDQVGEQAAAAKASRRTTSTACATGIKRHRAGQSGRRSSHEAASQAGATLASGSTR